MKAAALLVLSFCLLSAGFKSDQPSFLQLNYFGLQDKAMVPIIFTTNPEVYVKMEDADSRASNPLIYKLSSKELGSMISAVTSLKMMPQSKMLVYQVLMLQKGTIKSVNVQDRLEADQLFSTFIAILSHNPKQQEIGKTLKQRMAAIL